MWAKQRLGSGHRLLRVMHPKRRGADRWRAELEMFSMFAVQNHVDPALAEQVNGFGSMVASIMKSHTTQGLAQLST